MERPILYALAVVALPVVAAVAWCIVAAIYCAAINRRKAREQHQEEPESIPPGLT